MTQENMNNKKRMGQQEKLEEENEGLTKDRREDGKELPKMKNSRREK